HTDKAVYAGGETIYAAVYLANGLTLQPDSLSKTIYLELHTPAGEQLLQQLLFAADGNTAGRLSLPATVQPGIYQLTAYTNYQRNSPPETLFRKSLRIVGGLKESGGVVEAPESIEPLQLTDLPETNLRFFPESGDCISGLPCRVAVVAEAPNGAPLPFTGTLVDATSNELSQVTTGRTGIGTFTYTPGAGDYAVTDARTGRSYRLPQSRVSGTNIAVAITPDTVTITLRSNDATNGLRGQTFLLHLRGAGLFERLFTTADQEFVVRLPMAILPPGVLVGTILDPLGNATAERLFFVAPRDTDIEIAADKASYGPRASVNLALQIPLDQLPDSLNAARLSACVLPESSTGGPSADDIRSWLLLNSDVDRPVQQAPELIFAGSVAERLRRIDEFMLTRAWRRFRWEELPALANFSPEHLLERGLYVRGRMTKWEDEDAARPGKIFLTRLENAYADEQMTDEEGYFTLGPYITFDTFPVTLQGRFKMGRKNRLNPDISLKDNQASTVSIVPFAGPKLLPAPPASPTTVYEDYREASRKTLTVARTYDSLIIDLQTIDVTARRANPIQEARQERTRQFYKEPNRRLDVANNPNSQNFVDLVSLIRTLPGVQLQRNGEGNEFFQIRNSANLQAPDEAVVFLNGVEVRNLNFLRTVQMQLVDFIDVVSGQRAIVMGPQAVGG
ncbi:MAG: TonB-dependent receptor plug domain-containing protein, partial [Bacteroidota bacterium]